MLAKAQFRKRVSLMDQSFPKLDLNISYYNIIFFSICIHHKQLRWDLNAFRLLTSYNTVKWC